MIVTTTRPRSASFAPSYIGSLPEPVVSAPPWIQTNTGALRASAGAQTLSVQAVLAHRGRSLGIDAAAAATAAARRRRRTASRRACPATPASAPAGFQRRAPDGRQRVGMPLKTCSPPTASPRTLPAGASTTGSVCAARGHGQTARDDKRGEARCSTRSWATPIRGLPLQRARQPQEAAARRAHRTAPGYRRPSAANWPDARRGSRSLAAPR